MGRQLGIYMNQADEDTFVGEVTTSRRAVFSKPAPLTEEDFAVVSLPPIVSKPPKNLTYYIRPHLLDGDLVISEPPSGRKIIDSKESQVIEFYRSHVLDGICYPGRLWYEPMLSDGSGKPEVFVEWAEALFSWIREHYIRWEHGSIPYFVGHQTRSAVESNLFSIV